MIYILRLLKRIWIINLVRRVLIASTYFNNKYWQIIQWGFRSKEDTNFTYDLKHENIDYMAHTIAIVCETKFEVVLQYINECLLDEALSKHIILKTAQSDDRHIADLRVGYGRRLGWYAITRIMKPSVVIETGVDKGLGSVVLCAALLRNSAEGFPGKFYGTDINPKAGYLLDSPYSQMGEILYGDSIESLKKLQLKIDLFINDSDHSKDYEYQEYLTIENKLSPNGLIIGDNAHVTSKLSTFSIERNRNFLFYKEVPKNHWYPGGGIGFSYIKK